MFRDLSEFHEDQPVVLPVRGKSYAFPGSISARTWLRLQELNEQLTRLRAGELDPGTEAVGEAEQLAMSDEMLGDVKQQLLDDGITNTELRRIQGTLTAFHLYGREYAELLWERQGEPLAPTDAPAKPKGRRGSPAGSKPKKPDPQASSGATSCSTGD